MAKPKVFYRKGTSDWGRKGYYFSTIHEDERLWFGDTLAEAKKYFCEYHFIKPSYVEWVKMPN